MKTFRRLMRSPVTTVLLFVLAAALLLGGTVGGARAALNIESDFYTAGVELYDIGVSLVENGTVVGRRDYVPYSDYVWNQGSGALLTGMLDESNGVLQIGRKYTEALSVYNSGTIDEYVRVTVYRYWQDKNGNKLQTLSPDMIDLAWANVGAGGPWVMDDQATTEERNVLYYRTILAGARPDQAGVSRSSVPFTSTLTINADLPYTVRQTTQGNVITTTYLYDDVTFQIEATVDAVQTHNARDAIKSAWGLTDADIARLGLVISD